MTIPIYDISILPCLSLPMKNTKTSSKKYLGGKAITGEITLSVKVFPANDLEANALYNFWATDCNFGLEPFLAAIPLFGVEADPVAPSMLVQFVGDFVLDKSSAVWETELQLKLIGTIGYIIDDNGNFVVDDTGEYTIADNGDYIPTGNVVDSYRKVIYG